MSWFVAKVEYWDGSGVKLQHFKTLAEAENNARLYGGYLIEAIDLKADLKAKKKETKK